MKKHGFRIVDMWESRGDKRLEFVYLLEWPDEAARVAAWRAFMGDQEWSAVKRQTARQSGRRHRGPDTASDALFAGGQSLAIARSPELQIDLSTARARRGRSGSRAPMMSTVSPGRASLTTHWRAASWSRA